MSNLWRDIYDGKPEEPTRQYFGGVSAEDMIRMINRLNSIEVPND